MRNSKEVIGLSVYHIKTGTKLGAVSDLLFDDAKNFQGVLLESRGFFQSQKYIPKEKIVSMGRDAVIASCDAISYNVDHTDWFGIVSGQRHLKGRPILLSTGNEIGSVDGVYFMEEMGTLIGYELSEGFISDLRKGRKILKTRQPLIWGDEVCIVLAEEVEIKDI